MAASRSHDAESPDLVEVGQPGRRPSARGQPRARRDRPRRDRHRRGDRSERRPGRAARGGRARTRCERRSAYSLLETSASRGWKLAVELERALADARAAARRLPDVLDHPRARRCPRAAIPTTAEAVDRIVRSPLARPFGVLPGPVRATAVLRLGCRASSAALAAFAGPPSVAHAEALLRGVDSKSVEARRAARRDLHRHPARRRPPAAGGAESRPRRVPRPRARPPALARRVPARRGRDGDPPQPLPPALPAPDPAALPSPLPGAADDRRPRARRARRRPSGRPPPTAGRSPPIARAGSCHPLLPFAGLGRLPACRSSGSARCSSRAAATPPPRGSSASSRRTGSARRSPWHAAAPTGPPRIGFLPLAAVLPATRRARRRSEPTAPGRTVATSRRNL